MPAIYARQRRAGVDTGEKGRKRFRTEYRVKMDTPTATRAAVLACGLLPIYGSPHPEDLTATCVRVNADRVDGNPYIWDVQAEWDHVSGKRDPGDSQKPPDQRRPVWSYNFMPIPQYRFSDLDGVLFVDTAGTVISPPPEQPIWVDEITITRYESTLDRAFDRQYLNATNTDKWIDANPYEALVADIDVQEVFEQGQYWFQKKFTLHVNPFYEPSENIVDVSGNQITKLGGYHPHYILNAGPRMLIDDPQNPGTKIPVAVKLENFIDGQPWPIDAAGVPIPLENGQFTSPLVYLAFRTKNLRSFAPLNLIPPWQR